MTLTLGNTYKIHDSLRTNTIYFADYQIGKPENIHIDRTLYQILENYKGCNYMTTNHIHPFVKSPWDGLRIAEEHVKAYARAKLVITSRIHCALPCLALGTPVILVRTKFDADRFKGLFDFFNYLGVGEHDGLINTINLANGFVVNKTVHLPYAEKLTKICTSFCGNGDKKILPLNNENNDNITNLIHSKIIAANKFETDKKIKNINQKIKDLENKINHVIELLETTSSIPNKDKSKIKRILEILYSK